MPRVLTMGAFTYGFTKHGVMVQLHSRAPTDKEWTEMLGAIESRSKTLKSVIAMALTEDGPSSKQREALARTLKTTRSDLRFALLTDSRMVRGALTAINWLTRKHDTTAAFTTRDIEQALDFLQLTSDEKTAVRTLLKNLEGSLAAQSAAVR